MSVLSTTMISPQAFREKFSNYSHFAFAVLTKDTKIVKYTSSEEKVDKVGKVAILKYISSSVTFDQKDVIENNKYVHIIFSKNNMGEVELIVHEEMMKMISENGINELIFNNSPNEPLFQIENYLVCPTSSENYRQLLIKDLNTLQQLNQRTKSNETFKQPLNKTGFCALI